jgi:predicted nucleotidyltransferase
MTKQEVLKILERNNARLKEFNVSNLSLFGSVVRDEATPGSDID